MVTCSSENGFQTKHTFLIKIPNEKGMTRSSRFWFLIRSYTWTVNFSYCHQSSMDSSMFIACNPDALPIFGWSHKSQFADRNTFRERERARKKSLRLPNRYVLKALRVNKWLSSQMFCHLLMNSIQFNISFQQVIIFDACVCFFCVLSHALRVDSGCRSIIITLMSILIS